jgi:DNA invertase Pin-like site-specific DNA recombinase
VTKIGEFPASEREILRERVRAGLDHARQNGKRLGRPATAAEKTAEVRKLHRAGLSKAEIARRLASVHTVLDLGMAKQVS